MSTFPFLGRTSVPLNQGPPWWLCFNLITSERVYLQIRPFSENWGFGLQHKDLAGWWNSTSNSCEGHFSKFSSPCSKSFSVLSYQLKCKFLTLVFRLSHNPVSTYHYYFTSLHALYSMLQATWTALKFQTSHTFLPPRPRSRGSFCLKYLLLPHPPAHLRHPLLHYTFLVPLRYVFSARRALFCVPGWQVRIWSVCPLGLTCILHKSQDLPPTSFLPVPFLTSLT